MIETLALELRCVLITRQDSVNLLIPFSAVRIKANLRVLALGQPTDPLSQSRRCLWCFASLVCYHINILLAYCKRRGPQAPHGGDGCGTSVDAGPGVGEVMQLLPHATGPVELSPAPDYTKHFQWRNSTGGLHEVWCVT